MFPQGKDKAIDLGDIWNCNGKTLECQNKWGDIVTLQYVPPPDPPPLANSVDFVSISSYSFTGTRTTGDITTSVVVSVTETFTSTIGSDELSNLHVDVTAENGADANNLLSQDQLRTIAQTVADTIASAFSRDIDKTLALAIMEKETFYGTIGSRSDKSHNPGQYTAGIEDGRTMSAVKTDEGRRHNIDLTLDLYKQKERELKTTEPLKVLESYRGKGYEPTYNTQVTGISDRIRKGIEASQKSSIFITPYRYSPHKFGQNPHIQF